jgi:pimeloyl-ACP methyl ester carboxylesterase
MVDELGNLSSLAGQSSAVGSGTVKAHPSELVLLPGMMCDERLWAPQLEEFQSDNASVLVADLSRGASITQMAQQVLAVAPARFSLAGLSMGGIVAVEVWRLAPDRVKRLALLDTNLSPEDPARRGLRQAMHERVLAGELVQLMEDDLIPRYLGGDVTRHALVSRVALAMARDLGDKVFLRQSEALRERPDNRDVLGKVRCPAWVICGRDDQVCPVEYHQDIARRIPHAELRVIPACGHLATLDQPDPVNRVLAQWLAVPPGQ